MNIKRKLLNNRRDEIFKEKSYYNVLKSSLYILISRMYLS